MEILPNRDSISFALALSLALILGLVASATELGLRASTVDGVVTKTCQQSAALFNEREVEMVEEIVSSASSTELLQTQIAVSTKQRIEIGDCKALSYPRTIRDIFNSDDIKYLEKLWFNKLHSFDGVYMKLWRHLNETRDPMVTNIMVKLDKYVQDHFGNDFEIWDDFYSYRGFETTMFPLKHQDTMFWATDNHDCQSFNLWILLNHHRLNNSFDVYEIDKNSRIYEGVDLYMPTEDEQEIWRPRLEDPTYEAQATRVPLSIGEALVVKQPEIHGTDDDNISKDQWRLAIGFKVIRHGKINIELRGPLFNDANLKLIQNDPLLPDIATGSQSWSPYNASLLKGYWQLLDA